MHEAPFISEIIEGFHHQRDQAMNCYQIKSQVDRQHRYHLIYQEMKINLLFHRQGALSHSLLSTRYQVP